MFISESGNQVWYYCNTYRIPKLQYLGTVFTADADQLHDINARLAQAQQRYDTLRHLFNSPDLSISIKLRLYSAAVCSIITYGCETWYLNDTATRRINGANSRMLARITGRSIQQEARPASTSLDIVKHIRKIRLNGTNPERRQQAPRVPNGKTPTLGTPLHHEKGQYLYVCSPPRRF